MVKWTTHATFFQTIGLEIFLEAEMTFQGHSVIVNGTVQYGTHDFR